MNNATKNINLNISNGTILRVAFWILLFVSLIKLKNLVLVLLTAIVIASFVESAVYRFRKYIKNRVALVVIIYTLCVAILSGIFYIFLPIIVNEVSSLASEIGRYIPEQSMFGNISGSTFNDAKNVVSNIYHDASLEEIVRDAQNLANGVSGGFFPIIVSVFGGIVNLVLILIISFYLSVKEKGIDNFLRIIIPQAQEDYAIDLWKRTERKIGLWMQGQMLVGLIIGVLTYIGLVILGVKYALVLAIITAFSELIPFGMILAFVPAAIFGYLDGGLTTTVMITGLYIVVQQLEGYFIYPLVVKKIVGISPLVVILSLFAGATLAGFWGIILSIPVAVLLLEFLNDIEKKKILARDS